MKFTFTTCLLLYFSLFSIAQKSTFQLSGQITDANTSEVLSYVTLIAETPEGQFIEGTATDATGKYILRLTAGSYSLKYSFIGYENEVENIEISKDQVLDLSMQLDAQLLETVEVSEERTSVIQKIDRKVINVGKDLQSSGGDATEVLNQLPEIQSTPEGGVALRGSSNVNILVNGKPSPLEPQDLLQQLDASEIVQIELITSPSAKHRADGLTGIVNIITKKKKEQGFSASVSGSASSNQQYRSGLQLSQGMRNLNLNLNLNFSDRETDSQVSRSRMSEEFSYVQTGNRSFDGQVKSIKGGLDWFLNDQNEFSISGSFVDNSHDIDYQAIIEENGLEYSFISENQHAHISSEYNLNYRRSFQNKEHYLEADFHVTDNRNDLGANYKEEQFSNSSFLDYDTQISNFSLDYVLPISTHKAKLETGLLYTIKEVSNQQQLQNGNAEQLQNNFTFDERSLALYALAKKDWEKLKLQAGLRYEGFQSQSQFGNSNRQIDRNFNNLFPSFHLSYPIKDQVSLNLGYNRRISRPNLWHVNPYTNAFDRFFNRQGNPELNPEFSHNIELNLSSNFKKWTLNPSVFYRYKNNLILSTYLSTADNIILQSFVNEGNSHAYGAELAIAIFPWKALRTSINGNIYLQKINTNQENTAGFLNLYSNNLTIRNQFKINKKLNFDLTWLYRGNSIRRFSESLATQKIDAALRWKILNGDGNLNLRVTDIFNTFEYQTFQLGEGFEESLFRKFETQVAYLAFTYQLAKGKNAKQRQRKKRRFDEPGARE